MKNILEALFDIEIVTFDIEIMNLISNQSENNVKNISKTSIQQVILNDDKSKSENVAANSTQILESNEKTFTKTSVNTKNNSQNDDARISLNDLNKKDRERLIQKTMEIKFQTYRVKSYRKFKFENNTIQTKFLIKYLHSCTRFNTFIFINLSYIVLILLSIQSVKFSSNLSIIKTFVNFTKNTIRCKI